MPSLIARMSDGPEKVVPLIKQLTSVGRSPENSLVLDDPCVPGCAFHVELTKDGRHALTVDGAAQVTVNGKRRSEAVLAPGDLITIGAWEILFGDPPAPRAEPAAVSAPASAACATDVEALERLLEFSRQTLGRYDLEQLLETMIDQVIELTRADKGFLILLEDHEPRVKVARNLRKQNIEDAISRVSDSIIANVLRTRGPVIVADAINDDEFKRSQSVVNLKLLSVMCVPLTEKGEVFGLIYVGNDKFANHFEPRSLELLTIWAAHASLILRNAMLVNELRVDNAELRKQLDEKRYGEIIGSCQGMRDVYRKIDKVAGTDISVLITGETGTGKELIAAEIHQRSQRSKGPFVTINCGAIPENLLESELFGHVRGAFTGAVSTRMGRFQAASGGTLFLDEIGEMPMSLQVKILRALEDKQVSKVGDSRAEHVDIRVLAATNRVLEDEIKKGTFREDLYYRLNVITLKLPPLRERGDDVAVIGKYFLTRHAKSFDVKVRGFTPNAIIAMKKYGWPGNVRELENRIKKAVVLADKALVSAADLDLQPENFDSPLTLAEAIEQFRKSYINDVLARNGDNRTKAAKDLGVDPRTVFRHLEKLEAERSGKPLPPDDDEAGPN